MIDGIANGLTRSGPLVEQRVVALLERLEAADARSRSTRRCGRPPSRCRGRSPPPPAAPPRRSRCAKRSIAPRVLAVDPVGRVEVLHLAGEVHLVVGVVELRDRARAGLAREQRCHVVSTSLPSGDTAPSPVMTTRRRPFIDPLLIYIPSPPSTSSTSPVMNAAVVGAEEAYRPRDVLRLAEPAERRVREHRGGRLLGQDVGELRLDVAGRDDVRADVAAAELARERLREADDPGLRRRVVRLAPVAVDADDRRDVDDRAGALLHHRPASRRGTCRRPTRGSSRSRCASRRRTCARAGRRASGPALLTRMSRSPASSTSRAASSALETSAWTARPPIACASASASSLPER